MDVRGDDISYILCTFHATVRKRRPVMYTVTHTPCSENPVQIHKLTLALRSSSMAVTNAFFAKRYTRSARSSA